MFPALKKTLCTVWQVALLSLWWWCAQALCERFMPVLPGGVLGLVLLFLVLQAKWLPVSWVEQGSRWLLAEMLLFFIPAVVAVVQFTALFEQNGIRIMAVIVLSTACVMLSTALVVDRCYRLLRFRHLRAKREEGALCLR
ncbi:CidA/LrgA family protein [Craterilacuibacter sinensis]|uniref:CidA/LrgA family protein n=1 Tax=Craterilacuibacter sinensis TaxID=2686017 RepID=A0A845BHM5_9NEIS|nr:CidA/LrgA family protein [Craterilacuibacter sinensis]MXR35699.1 CidA/LrgA family protein [Craterilacuibacter sinensis]RQW29500.1 CidA/LrgA family protein [Rhodobacteraceae bacterium CH30]